MKTINPIISCFVNAINNPYNGRHILVKFFNRDYTAPFTFESFEMLVNDPVTEYIIDAETGEVLFDGNTKETTL